MSSKADYLKKYLSSSSDADPNNPFDPRNQKKRKKQSKEKGDRKKAKGTQKKGALKLIDEDAAANETGSAVLVAEELEHEGGKGCDAEIL